MRLVNGQPEQLGLPEIIHSLISDLRTMTSTASENLPKAGKYLTFVLESEHYSVPVLKVREITRLCPVTPVPRMPAFILGVINLRGKIVPVIDLRELFGLPKLTDVNRACVVVAQFFLAEGGQQLMGIIVDSVEEVSHFALEDVELPPDFGGDLDTRFITGMAKSRDTVKTLLDLDRLLNFVGALDFPSLVASNAQHSSYYDKPGAL